MVINKLKLKALVKVHSPDKKKPKVPYWRKNGTLTNYGFYFKDGNSGSLGPGYVEWFGKVEIQLSYIKDLKRKKITITSSLVKVWLGDFKQGVDQLPPILSSRFRSDIISAVTIYYQTLKRCNNNRLLSGR
jgi:hypothetical protein